MCITCTMLCVHDVWYTYTHDHVKQLRLRDILLFSQEKKKAGFELAMFCVLGRRSTN